MGLDVSHDAWEGAYLAFNRWRQAIARATQGSFPPHDPEYLNQVGLDGLDREHWSFGNARDWQGREYNSETHPGLFELLSHSDCDGEISPELAGKVADELEALLPMIRGVEADWPVRFGGGHLEREGGLEKVTKRFIAGCRRASAAGESLRFY